MRTRACLGAIGAIVATLSFSHASAAASEKLKQINCTGFATGTDGVVPDLTQSTATLSCDRPAYFLGITLTLYKKQADGSFAQVGTPATASVNNQSSANVVSSWNECHYGDTMYSKAHFTQEETPLGTHLEWNKNGPSTIVRNCSPSRWVVEKTAIDVDGEDVPVRVGQNIAPTFGMLHASGKHKVTSSTVVATTIEQGEKEVRGPDNPNYVLNIYNTQDPDETLDFVVGSLTIDNIGLPGIPVEHSPDGRPVGVLTAFCRGMDECPQWVNGPGPTSGNRATFGITKTKLATH
ncbi:hypothetical protein [Amycolatopsis sp. CA-230715]|uniref:hypothetical protein n=1 Tax=Amycolatopsis sp. CA-230715 TaxID=2745196 RepID=UPI001C01FAAF|nr:hypothetical protein [Amycolatopsis sp. CA-230715]